MHKRFSYISLLPIYFVILLAIFIIAAWGSRVVTVLSENTVIPPKQTIIIDAGHGGVDGGATSCTGVLESKFNLEIATKLNDFLHLLGVNTIMIRETDCSVYTQGDTIAQKKISDLRERVRIANQTENGILISIHQNLFSDSQYAGAQVFYAPTDGSKTLANALQNSLKNISDISNHRQSKRADNIYLMQNIHCPAVLIECGFLSNPQEEYLLRSKPYQQKLAVVIGSTVCKYIFPA